MSELIELCIHGEIFLFKNDFTTDQINKLTKIAETLYVQKSYYSDEQYVEQLCVDIYRKLGLYLERVKITKVIAF